MTLVTGLLGLSLFALGFGFVALRQIRRRGQRGRGLAIGGLIAGSVWLVASAVVAILLVSAVIGAGGISAFQPPKPGQCFDFTDGRNLQATELVPCDTPHDAEMVLTFHLPAGQWPGAKQMLRLGAQGCDQRFKTRFKTRIPVEGGQTFVIHPVRTAWRLGDRTVYCMIVPSRGARLSAPVGSGPFLLRAPDELLPGECFSFPSGIAKLVPCDRPHQAQLTHRFELPPGAWNAAVKKKAADGCERRWKKMFGKEVASSPFELRYASPYREHYVEADRLILCQVNGIDGRPLERSVIPR